MSKEELIKDIMNDVGELFDTMHGVVEDEFRERLNKRLTTKDEKLDELALYHAVDHFIQLMNEDGEVADEEDTLDAWHNKGDCFTIPEGFHRATEYEFMADKTIIEEVMTAYSVNQWLIQRTREILG